MNFGLYGLHKGENASPDALARGARAAEDAGFESIWVGDHIALPPDAPDDAFDPRLEAIVTLAHLAAVTERVKLGLGVIILPQRQPVLLAKQLTTVDVLSEGRLLVGLGVGYLEAELAALGSTLAERGARMDESIAAMRVRWDEAPPRFRAIDLVRLCCTSRSDQRSVISPTASSKRVIAMSSVPRPASSSTGKLGKASGVSSRIRRYSGMSR